MDVSLISEIAATAFATTCHQNKIALQPFSYPSQIYAKLNITRDILHISDMDIRHCTNHGVGVGEQVSEQVQESLILHQTRVDVVQLSDAHGGRLPHVRVLVLQTLPQGLAQVLYNTSPDNITITLKFVVKSPVKHSSKTDVALESAYTVMSNTPMFAFPDPTGVTDWTR